MLGRDIIDRVALHPHRLTVIHFIMTFYDLWNLRAGNTLLTSNVKIFRNSKTKHFRHTDVLPVNINVYPTFSGNLLLSTFKVIAREKYVELTVTDDDVYLFPDVKKQLISVSTRQQRPEHVLYTTPASCSTFKQSTDVTPTNKAVFRVNPGETIPPRFCSPTCSEMEPLAISGASFFTGLMTFLPANQQHHSS